MKLRRRKPKTVINITGPITDGAEIAKKISGYMEDRSDWPRRKPMPEMRPEFMPWRTGQSVGRTIYACPPGSSYRKGEILIGTMDSARLATEAVDAHNQLLKIREQAAYQQTTPPPDPETGS